MEAKSLMVGDWVLVDSKPTKVDNVDIDSINTTYVYAEVEDYIEEEKVSPIPLTPEILEKNGLELKGGIYIRKWQGAEIHWRRSDGYVAITAKSNLKLGGLCSVANGYFCYAHILQHALRLCGLNELADNFKV